MLSDKLGEQEVELRKKIVEFSSSISAQLKYYNNL
jgi:hypothetical protein